MDRVASNQMDDPNLPEIERQRLANMQRNRMMVDQLLAGTDTSLLLKPVQETKRQAVKPRKPKEAFQPSRRSDRNAGRERPDYRGQQELAVYVERQPRQPKLRERKVGAGRSSTGSRGAWHDGIPAPPEAARHKALAAAEDAVVAIEKDNKHKAYLKVLGPSMVSGGFWLQAPIELLGHFHQDLDVTFTCGDTTRSAETFKHTQAQRQEGDLCADAWTVGFLLKKDKKSGEHKGGVGFSKNWRGFAIDQFLHPEDIIVFEVTGAAAIQVHIFRAWDFASSPPADLHRVRFQYLGCTEEQEESDKSCSSHAAASAGGNEQADGEGADEQEVAPAAKAAEAAAAVPGSKRKRGHRKHLEAPAKKRAKAVDGAAVAPKKGRHSAAGAAAAAVKDDMRSKQGKGKKKKATQAAAGAAAAGAVAGGRKEQGSKQKSSRRTGKKSCKAAAPEPEEEEEDFVVDWIMDTALTAEGVRIYLVHWLGYPPGADSWEPAESFDRPLRSYDWKVPVPPEVQ